jgi:outer membrane protein assembly factor BamD (BamD/ComL family)
MPTVAELVERCRTVGDAAKLYKKADKAKKAGKTEYARRAYHAILRSKGAEKTQRRWAAYKLARIYIRQKQCAGAETVWRTYDRLSPGRKRFPGCP